MRLASLIIPKSYALFLYDMKSIFFSILLCVLLFSPNYLHAESGAKNIEHYIDNNPLPDQSKIDTSKINFTDKSSPSKSNSDNSENTSKQDNTSLTNDSNKNADNTSQSSNNTSEIKSDPNTENDNNQKEISAKDTDTKISNTGSSFELTPQEMQVLLDVGLTNVYEFLPKSRINYKVYLSKFSNWHYGPFQFDNSLYTPQSSQLLEITQRIATLSTITEKNDPSNQNQLEQKIHLADLYLSRANLTHKRKDAQIAADYYRTIYAEVPKKFYSNLSLNMTSALMLSGDLVTPLPILKKLYKDYYHEKEMVREINARLFEIYFLSRRYKKCDEFLDGVLKGKDLDQQQDSVKLRMGDNLFMMKRYGEAVEWYQRFLKPDAAASPAASVSWLYLAEALYLSGQHETSRKIYSAMRPIFEKTVYSPVIYYRLDDSPEKISELIKSARVPTLSAWIKVETLKKQFIDNPSLFPVSAIEAFMMEEGMNDDLIKQVTLIKADALRRNGKYFDAAAIYRRVDIHTKDPTIRALLSKGIIYNVYMQGLKTNSEMDAFQYLNAFQTYEFYFRNTDVTDLHSLILRNLTLLGIKEASAEFTLGVVEKSIQDPRQKLDLLLKLAQSFYDAKAYRSASRVLEAIDLNLLDFKGKEDYYRLYTTVLLDDNKTEQAIKVLEQWLKEGTSALNSYWIALKKVELNYKLESYDQALEVIMSSIGDSKTDKLPAEYQEFTLALTSYLIQVNNKLGKHHEALMVFEREKDRLLSSDFKYEIMLAALSSALALNKAKQVENIMEFAHKNLDKRTVEWLDKWTRGELWINQINDFLDKQNAVIKERKENGV